MNHSIVHITMAACTCFSFRVWSTWFEVSAPIFVDVFVCMFFSLAMLVSLCTGHHGGEDDEESSVRRAARVRGRLRHQGHQVGAPPGPLGHR